MSLIFLLKPQNGFETLENGTEKMTLDDTNEEDEQQPKKKKKKKNKD